MDTTNVNVMMQVLNGDQVVAVLPFGELGSAMPRLYSQNPGVSFQFRAIQQNLPVEDEVPAPALDEIPGPEVLEKMKASEAFARWGGEKAGSLGFLAPSLFGDTYGPSGIGGPALEGSPSYVEEVPAAPETGPSVEVVSAPAPVYSNFGPGQQVTDEKAKARIENLYDKLEADGVTGIMRNTTTAGYTPGTRMAEIGYENQDRRYKEHLQKMAAEQACHELTSQVVGESREDKIMTAQEAARNLNVNGKITIYGHEVTEQAIRGLNTRLTSPALSYMLGLRERISAEKALPQDQQNPANAQNDLRQLAEVLEYELRRMPDTVLKLRTRKNPNDIFAIVSDKYTPADAPQVLAEILGELPKSAKATWSYDPISTTWELRGHVWTPTPVDQQAVGEPFEGYVSFRSRDNGTAKFTGSGGITILACLNAGVYTAAGGMAARKHMGKVMNDIQKMLASSVNAIHTLCEAWGESRKQEVEIPMGEDGPVPLEVAIPGFWRYLLQDRRSELLGVLPGRSETHIKNLTQAYHDERRDKSNVVRSDFAQGWTRYCQEFPTPVRREAEDRIGGWLVDNKPLRCTLAEV